MTAPTLPPHPPLPRWYRDPAQRADLVAGLFEGGAPHYDRVSALLGLGAGGWYRRERLRDAGLRPGMRALDVAVGTGLVAREALRLGARVVGVDPSAGMLAQCRSALGPAALPLLRGRAEALPVAAASVDFLSLGYALRHIPDLAAAFAEFHRVLRPGGRLLILDKTRPRTRLGHAAARLWLARAVPALARLGGGGVPAERLFRYYWDTVEACAPPERIIAALRAAGFTGLRTEANLGVFRSYAATRAGG